jgi:NAD(P)-dependent dehydrogenase (short-subunit alcohol dehydrogenase family)
MTGVAGKVIAVTGVLSGIGRACARSLARQGALVAGDEFVVHPAHQEESSYLFIFLNLY